MTVHVKIPIPALALALKHAKAKANISPPWTNLTQIRTVLYCTVISERTDNLTIG